MLHILGLFQPYLLSNLLASFALTSCLSSSLLSSRFVPRYLPRCLFIATPAFTISAMHEHPILALLLLFNLFRSSPSP